MKKRAISLVLCLMMVVTLFGNGIPVYAANELEPPIVATEETSQDAPEKPEAEGSPAVEAPEAENTNAAGETSSEVAGTFETDEPTEATDAEETAEAEEGTESKPSEAADTEESPAVNIPETTGEAATEEKPDAATPAEAEEDIAPEARAAGYSIYYEFKPDPHYEPLPEIAKDLLPVPQKEVADGTVVTPPDLAVTEVKGISGIWHFQGWDKTTARVDSADVTFTGTWKLTQYKGLHSAYQFSPSTPSKEKGYNKLPQEVIDLLPDALEGLTKGQTITHPTPVKTEVEVDGGKWVFDGWAMGNTMVITANTTTWGSWSFIEKADTYTVNYEFKNLPAYRSLPQRVKDLLPAPQADVADGTVVTPPELAVTQVKDLSGIWHFQGWDKTTATVDGADVTFTGTWKLTQYKTFFASYNFVPSTASMDKGHTTLPQEVIDLIPDAMEGLTDGRVITHPTPAKTEVAADAGKWVFAGWPLGNTATVQNGNILTVGEWNFVERGDQPAGKHAVNYEFKSFPAYRSLPQRVKDLLPAPQADVADSTVVAPPELAVTQVKDLSGIWHFQGWDKTTATVDGADVTFTGTWKLTSYKGFFSAYDFVSSLESVKNGHPILPQPVLDLIPDAMEGLQDGAVITHPMPEKTEVAADGGKWVFAGWPFGNTATVQNGNILTVGEWNFVEGPDKPTMKYTITFKFVSLTNGTDGNPKGLPQEVLDLLPAPITNLEAGTNVTYPTLAKTEIPAEGGKWIFTGWPGGTGITITGSVLEVGGWRFDKESTPGTTPGTDPTDDRIGNLTVTKTVSGSRGDQNQEFTFTVTLDKQDLNGKYGDMTFTGGVATFTLKHGQSKTANGLPTGLSYTVEESGNSGYTVTKTNETGRIQDGVTAVVAFENYKGRSGGSGGSGPSSDDDNNVSHIPQEARLTLTASKTMDGLLPNGSEFTFFLDDANGRRLQVKNNQDGNITFDTLTFNKTGTYVYYLTEQTGNDKNINYDTASYKVTVTVTCPHDYVASVAYEKNGQAYYSIPVFENSTKPAVNVTVQTPPVVTPARPLDNVPKTEDSSNLALWGILAAASILSLAVFLVGSRSRRPRFWEKQNKH